MRLSSRRFWCGLILLMLCIGCMAIDSVSTRLKRLAVSYGVGRNVTLDDVSIRRQADLIKIDGLKVARYDGASQVNFLSERTYIKVDTPTLLDKRLISPKARMQGLRLELAAMPLEPSQVSVPGWQSDLQQLLVSLQLDRLKEDCDALMTTDDVLSELDGRVRGWVLRSQQIMFHADQLTASIQSFSNPLRHLTEIRQQLSEIEQLRVEQEQLEKQFAQFGTSIDKELAKIQVSCDADLKKMNAKTDRGAEAVRVAAAEQIVRDWTAELITQPLRLSRAVTILCNRPAGNPFDVDIRNVSKFPSALALTDLEATGLFVCAPAAPLRFTASGDIRTEQAADHRTIARSDLNFEFTEHNMATRCRVATKDSLSAWTVNSTTSGESLSELFSLSTTLSGDQVAGTAKLKIDQYERFTKLPCTNNADLLGGSTEKSNMSDCWIECSVAGTFASPSVKLRMTLPKEFVDAITGKMMQQIDMQRSQSERELRAAVESKSMAVRGQLEATASAGLKNISQQRETLASMHKQIQENLQARENYEYARLPNRNTSTR